MERIEENDIDDFGQGCCPNGRMRYHGGSRYYCDWCGRDEIRTMDLIPCPPNENIIEEYETLVEAIKSLQEYAKTL